MVQEAVEETATCWSDKVLVSPVASAGFGINRTTHYDKALGKDKALVKDKCRLVQEEVRAGLEELRGSQKVGMRQQSAWTRWEQAEIKISWSELWQAEPY